MIEIGRVKYKDYSKSNLVFTEEVLKIIEHLHDKFSKRVLDIRLKRKVVLLDLLNDSKSNVVESLLNSGTSQTGQNWQLDVPDELFTPGIEISGPSSQTSMFINGLNPTPDGFRADGDLDDDEDAGGHNLQDTINSALNRKAAVQGNLEYFDGTKYIGEFNNGLPHGYGEIWFAAGSHFVGEFSYGNPVNGTYTWPLGDIWEGPMLNLMKHGYGIYTYPPEEGGGSIEGDFINNYPNGFCFATELNGFIYVGDCKMSSESIYNGIGKMIFPDGSIYEGGVKDGSLHGNGIYTDIDGSRYEGNWLNGDPSGEFNVTLANGDKIIENY